MEYPKNIQLPFVVLMDTIAVLDNIDKNSLPENVQAKYDVVRRELYEKRSRIRNRFAYSEIIQAQSDADRETAVENYRETKKLPIYL